MDSEWRQQMKVSGRVLAVSLALAFQYAGASRKLPHGPPEDPPNEPGEVETPDLGDLIRLLRDESTGVPILTEVVPAGKECYEEGVEGGCCLWPLASEDCAESCVMVKDGYRVINPDYIDATCAVTPPCDTCTMETDFGRISSARAPADMFDKSYDEAIALLRQSVCQLYEEPSGRLGYFAELDGIPEEYTIDSPLSNLALYREVMTTGVLDLASDLFPGSTPPLTHLASTFFGAAFDKTGSINMDTVVYTNAIFDLPATTVLPTKCIDIRGEVMGEVAARNKCFIDYSEEPLGTYNYDRAQNFAGLPNPPYVPGGATQSGVFEFLEEATAPPALTFHIANAGIFEKVFPSDPFAGEKAALSFAKAADDTRAVINFMHNWPVPSDYVTPRVCTRVQATLYNLYIASLQVPKNINAGAEERELLVTVGNSGRDTAKDATVVVTGIVQTKDGTMLDPIELGYSGTDDTLEVDATESFDLDPAETVTFTGFVPVELTMGGEGSTINWIAEIVPRSAGEDIMPDDNIMTEETAVKRGAKAPKKLRAL
eukprot:CCRYP_010805-RA/>CCRYP_010805-RA protein AED:0.20 eAED:0.20 QI:0/0.5/0.33/1/0.5/0.33/3/142/542